MSRNLRQYARQTNVRLLIGFGLILFIIGDSLIYFIYGREAAILGFICLLAGLFPLVLIGLALRLMEKVVDRAQ
jgi:energy-converting hydrogenase Eha subunit E